MLRVGGVGQCFEEIGIATGSAAVFGWAGVRSVEANRELECRTDRIGSLHEYFVLPGVAEVILVAEPVVLLRDVGELELDFMQFFVRPVVEVRAVYSFTDPELVEVAVRPAHRLLDNQVEPVEANRARDKYPPPYLGSVVQQGDPQREDIRVRVRNHERRLVAVASARVPGRRR